MKDIELLFRNNGSIGKNQIKLDGTVLNIYFKLENNLFSGIEINYLIKIINAFHKKYGNLKIRINIHIGKVIFIDKLAYVFFECVCYYLIEKYGHPVQIYMQEKRDIYTHGIISSPLILLNDTKQKSILKFPKHFRFDLYGYHFRKLVKCEKAEETNYLGELDEQIDRFLKPFGIDKTCRNEIALVIIELVGNACEHARSDCLLDIDIAPDYRKVKNNKEIDDNYYYGINIAVINFSSKKIGSDIYSNVLQKSDEEMPERYGKVIEAYNNHLQMFNQDYKSEDFCNMTAFQKKISGRKEKFKTGGTGLPTLIKSLEDKSDTYRCYMISGDRCINFYSDLLEYDEDGFIGFNEEKDYINKIPKKGVVTDCLIHMPGTAFNLNFVMKGVQVVMENRIELIFEKADTRLAGNPYGKSEYEKQVKSKIDFNRKNVIVFPKQIERVASSFVQGFFAEIIEKVGYAGFDELIKIEAADNELAENIRNDLFV